MITLDLGPVAPSRKSIKKGIEFNLMIVGESGLGKSTFINTLLNTLICERDPSQRYEIQKTVKIHQISVDLEDRSSKIRLTIIDTPGFGNSLNNTDSIKPISDYIDEKLMNYFQDESGLNRRSLQDNRVHCCVYFIEPSIRGLKAIDIAFMLSIHEKANIVPVIAKADSFTNNELIYMKQRVLDDLRENKIKIYELPECDSEDNPNFVKINEELRKLFPFSVIGGIDSLNLAGKTVRGRRYPWGFVDVDDENHSDFIHLRNMLLRTHVHDLRDITEEIHYENFRAAMLIKSNPDLNLIKNDSYSNMNQGQMDSQGQSSEVVLFNKVEIINPLINSDVI